MPTVKNLSYGPLSIARPEGDPLTLGPRETAQISEKEFESDQIQRYLREKRIAIIPGEARAEGRSRNRTPKPPPTQPAE